MRTSVKLILLSLSISLVFWFIEAEIQYYTHNSGTLPGALLFEISVFDMFSRLWVVLSFIIFGIIAAQFIGKREAAEKKADEAYTQLNDVFNSTADGMCLINRDYTVVRVNDPLVKLIGIPEDNIVGRKCYDMFRSERCRGSECFISRIVSGEERVETELTKITASGDKRNLFLTATPCRSADGRILGIVETLDDITERKTAEELLIHRLELEKLLASISTDFINLASGDVDRGIREALRAIGEFAHVDRSYVFMFRNECGIMDNSHEWCGEGIEPEIDNLQGIPSNTLPWWMEKLRNFENIHIPRVSELPPEASKEKEVLASQNIKSLFVVALEYNRELIGFLGFDSVRAEKVWNDGDIRVLKMAGDIIASAIVRIRTDRELRELYESREELEKIVNNSPAIAFLWRAQEGWPVEYVSDNISQFGYTPDDLYNGNIPFASMIHKDDRDRVVDEVQYYSTRPDIHRFEQEYRIVTRDGKVRWVDDRSWIRRNKHGTITHYQGLVFDITARKTAEQKLEFERKQLLSIFDSISEAIYVSDPETYEVLFVNRFLRDKLGHDPVGGLCYEEFQNADTPCSYCTNHILLSNGTGEHQWEFYNKKFKSYFLVSDRLIKWPDGRDVRFEIAIDITSRKESERMMNRLITELESKNRELEDFAYVVSHDLKAPLRAIGTLSEWISTDYADRLDDNGKEQLALLIQRVKRMHDLIDGVLRYSRIGRIKEEHVPVDLERLLPEVIDMIAPPGNITVNVAGDMPTITAERTRMQQIFENLLSNAVKYMDKPEGKIDIGCSRDNGFWTFSVTDNGPGIEEKYHERIFKIFQTLNSRDEFESTGVGLTLVKKIVTMYGGTVRVESKVGEGSTFIFTLPYEEAAEA